MKRWFATPLAMTAAVLLASPLAAKALVVRVPSLPEQVVQSDAIIVGKVQALEEKPVEAKLFVGAPQKVPFTVANVHIDEVLLGLKSVTHIRVGFIPQPAAADPSTGTRPAIRPRGGLPNPTLKVNQEGCFFLQKHPDGDFYILTPMSNPLDRKDENYKKQVANIQKSLKLLAAPVAALQSPKLDDRLFTASLLVQKYRQFRNTGGGQPVQQPIGAEESRLILEAIAEADWNKNDPDMMVQSGQMLFNMLGIQPKDGWKPPQVQPGQNYQEEYQKAAKKWLKDNATKFRMQKWTTAESK